MGNDIMDEIVIILPIELMLLGLTIATLITDFADLVLSIIRSLNRK